jgi:hypothetical protein
VINVTTDEPPAGSREVPGRYACTLTASTTHNNDTTTTASRVAPALARLLTHVVSIATPPVSVTKEARVERHRGVILDAVEGRRYHIPLILSDFSLTSSHIFPMP